MVRGGKPRENLRHLRDSPCPDMRPGLSPRGELVQGPLKQHWLDCDRAVHLYSPAQPRPPQKPVRRKAPARRHRTGPAFTLANERTFLAWIRTSLALLAGGIAVEAFTTDVFPEPVRRGLAVLLLLLGMLLSAGSAIRWLRVESSLRSNRPLPLPLIGPLLAAGCAVAAAVVIAVVVLG